MNYVSIRAVKIRGTYFHFAPQVSGLWQEKDMSLTAAIPQPGPDMRPWANLNLIPQLQMEPPKLTSDT